MNKPDEFKDAKPGEIMKFNASEETEIVRLLNAETYPTRKKFLILEDDAITQEIWITILKQTEPDAFLLWASSAEEASALIAQRENLRDPFDFVIADVNLDGVMTGIELWKKHGQRALSFLFGSSISFKEFSRLTGDAPVANRAYLVRKPFDPGECAEMVRTLLYYKGVCETDYTE